MDKCDKIKSGMIEMCRESISPLQLYNNKFKYYGSASTILLKLKSELRKKSTEWFM